MARKSGLGKGLDALFLDNSAEEKEAVTLKLTDIEPNKDQPRKVFDEQALAALADSIREHGVIQPLLVRPMAGGRYQIVAGERRWRASRMAGLQEVPVIIREMDDRQSMEIALIENLQREDLNAIEEAQGYQELMDSYQLTQEEVSQRVGKSRSAVANALRLLSLPQPLRDEVKAGRLSAGQGRALLAFGSEPKMMEIANDAIRKGTSVRELERLANKEKKKQKPKAVSPFPQDSVYSELEISMQQELGRKVRVEILKGEQGRLILDFYNKEELMDMAFRLTNHQKQK